MLGAAAQIRGGRVGVGRGRGLVIVFDHLGEHGLGTRRARFHVVPPLEECHVSTAAHRQEPPRHVSKAGGGEAHPALRVA